MHGSSLEETHFVVDSAHAVLEHIEVDVVFTLGAWNEVVLVGLGNSLLVSGFLMDRVEGFFK